MKKLRKNLRGISLFIVVNMVYQIVFPATAWALTGGPSQPEVQSFEPVGTTEMVELSTGDFNYNIPLLDIEGYPINIAYHGGIGMDDEASWVGLGWNINPGVINRSMRGLPDDFNGEKIIKEMHLEPNKAWGVVTDIDLEVLGWGEEKKKEAGKEDKDTIVTHDFSVDINVTLGINHNTYKGVGFEFGIAPAINAGQLSKLSGTASLGFTANSQEGFSLEPSVGLSYRAEDKAKGDKDPSSVTLGLNASASFNSRSGLKNMSYGASARYSTQERTKTRTKDKETKSHKYHQGYGKSFSGSTISFGTNTYTPNISMQMKNYNLSLKIKGGTELKTLHPNMAITGYKGEQALASDYSEKKAYGYMYSHHRKGYDVLLDFNREKDGIFSENTSNLAIANYTYDLYSVSGQGIGAQYRPYRSDIGVLFDDNMSSSSTGGKLGGEFGISDLVKVGIDVAANTSTSKSGVWRKGNEMLAALATFDYTLIGQPLYEPVYFKSVGEHTPVDKDFYDIFGYDKPVSVLLGLNAGSSSLEVVNKGLVDPYDEIGHGVEFSSTNIASNTYVADNSLVTSSLENNQIAIDKIAILSSKPQQNVRKKRDKRNEMIHYLTGLEATYAGLNKGITSYAPADIDGVQDTTCFYRAFNTDFTKTRLNHISEVTALNPQGMRYVYGIPAYNNTQEEHTFNVAAPNGSNNNCAKGLITYTSGMDSKDNAEGIDKYYSKTITPEYAHSYLLTSVLSADYVDVKGDGVTFDDDLGTAVKINYQLHQASYKWRTPYGVNQYQAYYNEGHKSDNTDDKASYIYGTKEIWYVSSIESKNYIAEFSFSRREDGLGVLGRHGGRDVNEELLKLDKITLYSRTDRQLNGRHAVPVKTVYFEYDYSLCPNVENNSRYNINKLGETVTGADTLDADINVNINKGKLTLKKIYFSYGKSKKAALSPYRFTYNQDNNPAYNIKAYDRWGNYKSNPDAYFSGSCGLYTSNADFPYVIQNKDSADLFASSWSLTRIDLPSGGQINVTYESDDYAYVQHKRAMQMMQVIGVGNVNFINNHENVPIPHALIDNAELYENKNNHYYYIFFELDDDYDQAADLKRYFLDENLQYPSLIYYNLLVDMKDANQHHEYVKGYAELDKYSNGVPIVGIVNSDNITGVSFGSNRNVGFLKVKSAPMGDKEKDNTRVSPMVKTAWQYARLQRPELVHPGSDPNKTDESAIRGLVSALSEVTTLWKSFNKTLQNKGYAKHYQAQRSWIRLYNPSLKKLGGGVRVKKLELKDQWKEMTLNNDQINGVYGQEYTYTTTQKVNGNNVELSSGVASYEPLVGNDENPWRTPVFTTVENVMAPDERNYTETPFGESFFPTPTIVYGKVTVKNVQHDNVKKHATGKVEHEFYTAKDFPTIVRVTPLDKKRNKSSKPLPREIEDNMTASQGYCIELNDMHGKPKAQWVYAEDSEKKLSGVEYKYQVSDEKSYPHRLNNKVKAFDKEKNIISEVEIATEIDFYVDAREQSTNSFNGTMGVNLDITVAGIIPIPLPMLWPYHSFEKTLFRSISATKIVNRFGVLKKTIAHQDGSVIETENVLYDAHTGGILLTRTQNEFRDSIFNFTYPAHFAYEGMGQAYKNSGAIFHKAYLSKDTIMLQNGLKPADYFYPGDEVMVVYFMEQDAYSTPLPYGLSYQLNNPVVKYWVHKSPTTGKMFLIDRNGYTVTHVYPAKSKWCMIKIVRSGRRNLQNIPIAQTVSMINPIVGDSLKFSAATSIIDANAAEFSDQWGMYCNDFKRKTVCFDTANIGLRNELYTVLNRLASSNKLTKQIDDSIGAFYDTSFFAEKLIEQGCSSTTSVTHGFSSKFATSTIATHQDEFTFEGKFKVIEAVGESNINCECSFLLYQPDSNPCIIYSAILNYRIVSCETLPCDTTFLSEYFVPYTGLDQISQFMQDNNISANDTTLLSVNWNAPLLSDSCFFKYSYDSIVGFVNDISSGGYYAESTPKQAFTISAIYSNGDTVQISGKITCPSVELFTSCYAYCEFDIYSDKIINPYVKGIRGNWRKKKDLLHLTERNYTSAKANARKDGTYKTFSPYWKFDATTKPWKSDETNWTWTSEVTKYSPQGFEIENRDALNRYSAALYASNNLPVAVGSNAKLRQLAYDGFEDLTYSLPDCELQHWNFKNTVPTGVSIDTTKSHTGVRSLKMNSGTTHLAARKIFDCSQITPDTTGPEYRLQPCDCIDIFSPDTGYKYVLSAWVRDNVAATTASYTQPSIKVELISSSGVTTLTFKASGRIIEGWQRVDTTFFIPYGTTAINIITEASSSTTSWFDDLRIHPFDGNLKSYVYNPVNLRLMAELDENNFATFYEYDEQGALIRVKKETERGIVTLKESRNSSYKLNP